jgi:hypothetical protein
MICRDGNQGRVATSHDMRDSPLPPNYLLMGLVEVATPATAWNCPSFSTSGRSNTCIHKRLAKPHFALYTTENTEYVVFPRSTTQRPSACHPARLPTMPSHAFALISALVRFRNDTSHGGGEGRDGYLLATPPFSSCLGFF